MPKSTTRPLTGPCPKARHRSRPTATNTSGLSSTPTAATAAVGKAPSHRRSAEERAGYKNPPKHTQFRKGQSGNPKGRPRGAKNLVTLIEKFLDGRVQITENGRARKVSRREALIMRVWEQAIKGNVRAFEKLVAIDPASRAPAEETASSLSGLSGEDAAEIVSAFEKELLERHSLSVPSGCDDARGPVDDGPSEDKNS